MEDHQKLGIVLDHMERVESNLRIIARKILKDDRQFALRLIKLGREHDTSKLDRYEFENLIDHNSPLFKQALFAHQMGNKHHPEFWGGIHNMPEIYVAEMVCDCAARGQLFGTSVEEWFTEVATEKYQFKMEDPVGKLIIKYMELLLDKPFKIPINKKSVEKI